MSVVSNYILTRVHKLEKDYKTLSKVPKNHETLIEIREFIKKNAKEKQELLKNEKSKNYFKKWSAVKKFYMSLECKNKNKVTAEKFSIPVKTIEGHVYKWKRGSLSI